MIQLDLYEIEMIYLVCLIQLRKANIIVKVIWAKLSYNRNNTGKLVM